ncbi:MAG: lysophospholipase [Chloroflexi bacterium]|nr:lysophospholipase [Chloroflexota bacterium]
MQHSTATFTGLYNIPIFTQHWLPDETPRAVVIIVHGVAEHSGRYAHVAAALTGRGYAVYALDHRGHGQSGGTRVHVEHFDDFVADLETYFDQVRTAQPGLPVFVLGHSMGSLISLLFASRHQDALAGLITTGTALQLVGANPAAVIVMRGVARLIPQARMIKIDSRGVSRNPSVVEKYRADPLNYLKPMTMCLLKEMSDASQRCAALLPELRIPYLALHGSADPLCAAQGTALIEQHCASADKTVKIYEGLYHEVLNEPEQEQVIGDVIGWLEKRIK